MNQFEENEKNFVFKGIKVTLKGDEGLILKIGLENFCRLSMFYLTAKFHKK